MILIGHPDIPYNPLYYVESVDEIKKSPSGSALWLGSFKESRDLVKHCFENGIEYAVTAESIKDAVMANSLHARYIVAPLELAIELQKIAETYLFDAKILVPINDENEIERVAKEGVDGVIFSAAIIA